jgi:hypothetical protein
MSNAAELILTKFLQREPEVSEDEKSHRINNKTFSKKAGGA